MAFFNLAVTSVSGGNVLCLYTWGHRSGPYVQAMHCLFGVGAFVAPLIAEPFLSHQLNSTNLTAVVESTTLTFPLDKRDEHVWMNDLVQSARIRREVEANDTIPSLPTPAPKPTKPKVADAIHLNADRKFADGSQLSHDLKKMEKQQKLMSTKPVMSTTPPLPPEASINRNNKTVQESLNPTATVTPPTTTTVHTTTTTTTTASTTPFLVDVPNLSENQTISANSNSSHDPSTLDNLRQQVTNIITVIHSFSKVQFAYLVIAGTVLLVSFLFMVACCRGGLHLRATRNQDPDTSYGVQTEGTGFRIQILILLFLFYFLYVGMEVTFGGFAMTFSVMFLGWSKAKGSLLTSTFWGAIAAGRALAVFLARCLTPPIMLILDLVIVIFALIGLVMASESSDVVVWVCSAMLGIGMASIFPTGITWAERYMHVTGKFTSVFVVGSALGEMLMPALAGFLFEAKGPMWLLYILLAASVFSIIIYIIMQNLATNMGERYNRLHNIPHTMYYSPNGDGVDPELEMNTLTPTSSTYSDDWSLQRRKKVTFDLNGSHANGKQRNGDLASESHGTKNGDLGAPKHSILKAKVSSKTG